MSQDKPAPTILIVDNDITLRLKMQETFHSYGFDVWVANNGKDAVKIITSLKPDAVITAMSLPRLSGFDLCRELRQSLNIWTPVLLIAEKADELEAVLGFELGADDYLVKPLRLKEVVARVKSVIRRGSLCCDTPSVSGVHESEGLLENGALSLDPVHFTLYKNGDTVELTRKEYELVYYLLKNKGKAFTREHLKTIISGDDHQIDERIIDVFISRIRRRIEPKSRNPVYIKTVRNVGYMMKEIKEKKLSY
ncbi:response regulator transcription factor [Salipaludibacillus aurantiacus]|uniref:Two-component system, OmpR family, alkaline phosphatase synthesis response regulator PhoP n=1 Tax=Salipaludibacillus aurantiacus TaxID=1601833 RepID=A0A1H9T6X1_9BACI|nr:response regulator transcription factor [Salipaludibacillus aurantiacus]SER93005.1 two-component system, OmpR family, alkaline phosphatase synthesis response regulator PhoP [Salipaludibacillus aurantiacus]